jgi:hypothetical protein
MSQILVKERGWKLKGLPILIHDLNGRSVHCYGVHQLSICIRDAFGNIRKAQQMFYTVDMDEHQVMLGYL